MGDDDLVEQSGERVEDTDVDAVAEQQQDVAPVFEQPAQGANKFTWAFVVAVVTATGLGSARWSRRLCLENYTHRVQIRFLGNRKSNSLTHEQKYEEDGGEYGDAVEHDGEVLSDVFQFIVVSHQQRRQKESCCHSELEQFFFQS